MKIFHTISSVLLIILLSTVVLYKTFLIGGKHLFPYFGFVFFSVLFLIFYISKKEYRKQILKFALIYLSTYIIFAFSLFKIFHWPNHDNEIIDTPKEYVSYQWKTETPKFENFDTLNLSKILINADKIEHLRSVLIVKDEKLIVENYYHKGSKNQAFNIFLISQTIMSSLIGIAIDEKFIGNVNDKMIDYFPQYRNKVYILDKADITIENLLTNTAGLSGNRFERSFNSLNWTRSSLKRPKINKTGDFFFQQQTAHLLSAIITETSGMNTRDFANKYLCIPLGIKIIDWFESPEGIYRGSNAIYLTARDIARFGNFYLSDGKIDNKQIISKNWIEQSIFPHIKVEIKINENFIITGAGYSWLSGKINDLDVFLTTSLGGQFILNIPSKNITIVTTTYKPFDYQKIDDLIYKIISTIK